MPPKVKITKEDIIGATINLVRKSGADAINARTVASALNCSTQPIFSNFATMDELRFAVVKKADTLCDEYIQREIESGEFPDYKASGMAYIRFAKEEKELFKLLYMRDRSNETVSKDFEISNNMKSIIHNNTGLDGEAAMNFHLEMWAYVHGIAAMIATNFLDLDKALISKMITDAYQGLKKHYKTEK